MSTRLPIPSPPLSHPYLKSKLDTPACSTNGFSLLSRSPLELEQMERQGCFRFEPTQYSPYHYGKSVLGFETALIQNQSRINDRLLKLQKYGYISRDLRY